MRPLSQKSANTSACRWQLGATRREIESRDEALLGGSPFLPEVVLHSQRVSEIQQLLVLGIGHGAPQLGARDQSRGGRASPASAARAITGVYWFMSDRRISPPKRSWRSLTTALEFSRAPAA